MDSSRSSLCNQQPQFSLSAPPRTPNKIQQVGQGIESSAYRKFLLEKRKSFRQRGSLGPTIASAPSVEHEDYRTPRPCDTKNGKSFDFGGNVHPSGSTSSDNAFVKFQDLRVTPWEEVSADFLRLNGSRQQFRNLLSARKKLGQMPPAYTRVDCSRDSLDSQPFRPGHHGPVITVEDTGSQLKINRGKTSITSSILDSTKSSFDKGNNITFVETGNGSVCGNHSNFNLRRNNSRYGVPINSSAVKLIYRVRAERLNNRVRIVDRALTLAMIGVVLMIIESEITGQRLFGISKEHVISLVMRSFVVLTTVALLFHILLYHINEIVLDLVDCGADDWRVVMTTGRIAQFVVEFSVCAICPIPGTGHLKWAYIETSRNPVFQADGQQPSNGFAMHEVPVDVILSLLMLFRSYLLARFMVLHSKQFQDASTRTLAALNRIQVNFSFVMKTLLDQQPIFFLTCFTLVFWILTSWTFVQCERYGNKEQAEVPSIMYSNALWFIAITFMLNGYGDIVPQTHAGRIIAIFVGVVGAIISSILIAVISRNILLSQGQRNVNNFMNDSKLTREHKHAAARVLQHTWYIHKCLQSSEPSADGMLRFHQRRFLHAIHRFRAIKNEIRVFGENNSANTQQVTRLVAEMHSSMQKLLSAHEEMRAQIEVLQRAVRNHYAHHGNCSSRVVFFEETPAVEGAEPTIDHHSYSHQVTSSNGSPGRSDSYSRRARRAFTVDSNFL